MSEHERKSIENNLAKLQDALKLLKQLRLRADANLQWRRTSLDIATKLLEELAAGLEKDQGG
jgi:hypothetical protein